jgi:hypothetical protein
MPASRLAPRSARLGRRPAPAAGGAFGHGLLALNFSAGVACTEKCAHARRPTDSARIAVLSNPEMPFSTPSVVAPRAVQ